MKCQIVIYFILLFSKIALSQVNLDSNASIIKANLISETISKVISKYTHLSDSFLAKIYIDIDYSKVRISDGPMGYYILVDPDKDSVVFDRVVKDYSNQIDSGSLTISTISFDKRIHRAYQIMDDISFLNPSLKNKRKLLFLEISKPVGGWDDLYLILRSLRDKNVNEYLRYTSNKIVLPVFISYSSPERKFSHQIFLIFNYKVDVNKKIFLKFESIIET